MAQRKSQSKLVFFLLDSELTQSWGSASYMWSRKSHVFLALGIHSGNTWGQRRPSTLINLQALYKQEVKAKTKLLSVWLRIASVSQYTQSRSAKTRIITLFFSFFEGVVNGFKTLRQSMSILLAQHKMLLVTQDKGYRLYWISSQKSLNKPQQIATINP